MRAMLESMKVAEPLSKYAGNKNRLIEELLDKMKPKLLLARCCGVRHAK